MIAWRRQKTDPVHYAVDYGMNATWRAISPGDRVVEAPPPRCDLAALWAAAYRTADDAPSAEVIYNTTGYSLDFDREIVVFDRDCALQKGTSLVDG